MSGGVDSSVAAALLHEQGYELVGVTLHLWDAEGEQKVGRCCAPEDRDDARRVCDHLGIPHYVLDEREAFREHVVTPFAREYLEGRTPAPCVHCNRTVKLQKLVALADSFGATHVATGHYARLVREAGDLRLLRGRDREKDQSYFLFGVSRSILERLLFPLGELPNKEATRAEGRRLGVPNADKGDSQELCFVPDGDIGGFLSRAGHAPRPGRIEDETGAVVGEHSGIERFTVGQRKGLGLGGGPVRYVLRIVPDENRVVVGGEDGLFTRRLRAADASWFGSLPDAPFEASIRIRHRHEPAPARIVPHESGFEAEFLEPQRAVTPGQAAVLYRGDEVVGGGFIV